MDFLTVEFCNVVPKVEAGVWICGTQNSRKGWLRTDLLAFNFYVLDSSLSKSWPVEIVILVMFLNLLALYLWTE